MPEEADQPSQTAVVAAAPSLSPWGPIKRPVFRMLWTVWLTANICMWMNDVAAAWLMTSMTSTPLWVALVQSASTLPVFLLGLPSGALADILDRRRYFIMTQFWVAGVATLLCISVIADVMMPGMDGPSTLKALRELPATAQTPVIFMTAKVQAAEVAQYMALGAIDVIHKPFDPMELSAQIGRIWALKGG